MAEWPKVSKKSTQSLLLGGKLGMCDMGHNSAAKKKSNAQVTFFTGISAPELLGNWTVGTGTVGQEPLELDPAEE